MSITTDADLSARTFERFLQRTRVHMVAANDTCPWIDRFPWCRKDPEPGDLFSRVGILAFKCTG
ncbi:MAG: hypothetical protein PF508_18850 [Spirochaeta sp.]|jgi:hypothetical protein|nr:hypothetical protein [Spirochaeta sp.]